MADPIQGPVLLAGLDENGNTVLLKLNADGTLSGSGGGISDHGLLNGLADDDHTQYLQKTELAAALGSRSLAELGTRVYSDLTSKPTIPVAANAAPPDVGTSTAGTDTGEYANEDHGHALTDQSLASRKINLTFETADVITDESTTSTSFTDLSTVGPAVTLNPGSGVVQNFELITSCQMYNLAGSSVTGWPSVAIAGATALDANAMLANSISGDSEGVTRQIKAASHAANVADTMKYRVDTGTMHFLQRRITGKAI